MLNSEELVSIRRKLHSMPEIGLEEYETHNYLMEVISKFDQSNLEIREVDTAILVFINGSSPTKTIGWRTDIDGLPITERTNLSYSSVHNGRMHACGHDFHMTIALGVLEYFCSHQPNNNMLFLFQPAEENESGGKILFDKGAFGEWLPDEFYALHVDPSLPVGTISTKTETLFAGTCEIHAGFIGKGGHAAFPHLANDMIIAATSFVEQCQTIVSRNVNPTEGAVITIGTFNAGTTNNVIAEEAHLSGTIRTLTQTMNELTQKRVREISEGVEKSYQCKIDLKLVQKGYLPVVNNETLTNNFIKIVKLNKTINFVEAEPAMTGEDFGYLLSKVPGTMFWLGVDSEFGLHHAEFKPKEEAIPFALSTVIYILEKLDDSHI